MKQELFFPTKMFINYEERNSKFTVKKLGIHGLNQVIKVSITSDKTY